MLRIGFVGVPCTGKTTLARRLRIIHLNTGGVLISEYAREYMRIHGAIKDVLTQYHVVDQQISREVNVHEGSKVLISDSPAFLGLFYASTLDTEPYRDVIGLMRKKLDSAPLYDYIFHLPINGVPIEGDSIRLAEHLTESWRRDADAKIHALCKLFPAKNYIKLGSPNLGEVLCYLQETKRT